VVVPLETLVLESGERLQGEIKYYDYGVVSVVYELPFADGWSSLSAWPAAGYGSRFRVPGNGHCPQQPGTCRSRPCQALRRMAQRRLPDLHIIEISGAPTVTELIQQHGSRIAQVVRGDTGQLAETEINEVMQSRISYYANDLTVIGWNAAFLYDSSTGAETAIQLLEYANSQLLEFRHYDDLLTEELERVYKLLDEGTGVFAQWRLARSATRLHTVLLDVAELTEHSDNAIKFLSDMFSARLYRLAAAKVGVPITRTGHAQSPHRRGTLPLHGRPVQPEPRILPRTHRRHHPRY